MLAWALIVYGATIVVTTSAIGAPVRAFVSKFAIGEKFITCATCVGWWVAFAVSFTLPELALVHASAVVSAIASGFAGAALCAVMTTLHVALAHVGRPTSSSASSRASGMTTADKIHLAPPRTAPPCAGCGS